MPKLNQIIAIEKGVKSRVYEELTEAHHALQKPALLAGINRSYTPKDEEGEQLPSESTKVQVKAGDMIDSTIQILARLFDVVFIKDKANQEAEGTFGLGSVAFTLPATYLLFLEKQLVDLHTFIKKLPILDPSEDWAFDEATGQYAAAPVLTNRTKKVPRNHVKAEATKEHPAQVEMWYEDISVGTWKTVKFSGALPATEVNEMLRRVVEAQEKVKFAREQANLVEVKDEKVGEALLRYIFEGV